MSYKLVALDIDGTIRSNEHPLTDRMRQAVSRVVEVGAVVTLATGRMFRSAARACAELSLHSPVVSFQGAHIADPITGQVLWHRPLTPGMAQAALDALAPWDLEVVAYHHDQVYVARMTPFAEGYAERNAVRVNVVKDRGELAAEERTRLVAVGGQDEIRRLEAELKATFESALYVTRSLPNYCEILHPEGGKDKALAWLCNYLSIAHDQTVAFGNGYNDVQMLAWSGLGVAIGGAVPEALEVADRVAPPIEQDGAAQVLEDLLARGLIG